jgi:hypothetical protein
MLAGTGTVGLPGLAGARDMVMEVRLNAWSRPIERRTAQVASSAFSTFFSATAFMQ